jgi:uncharacterized repeat protein (TIGR03837 family)
MPDRERWDVFCQVVDNFGDAGVAFRLSRCLAREHGKRVRLWLDDLTVLAKLHPATDADARSQVVEGVEVRRWLPDRDWNAEGIANVVVETFGCETPEAYVEAMAGARPMPKWINLEYLSAEAWVESSHALPSPHPRFAPLTRHFFFPGFTGRTGGLLRERGLLVRRDQFQSDRDTQAAFWRSAGIEPPPPEALAVSFFGYAGAPYEALLDALARHPGPVWVVAPEGVASAALSAWLGPHGERKGEVLAHRIPFLPQDRYDELLWACDVNFVRGEDSFVRAHWAARPFVWQPYPQDDGAHRVKLGAFLARYTGGMDRAHAAAVTGLWEAWNSGEGLAQAWPAFEARREAIGMATREWCRRLCARADLATALVDFADNVLVG